MRQQLSADRLRGKRDHVLSGGVACREIEDGIDSVADDGRLYPDQATVAGGRNDRLPQDWHRRRQPLDEIGRLDQVGKLETGRTAHLLEAAERACPAAPVDGVERVLE